MDSTTLKPRDFIDFRSDVVSIPPVQMLQAMKDAQVGDDVFEDDPTANKFQQTIAKYFGFEASMIVPSTTMANLISVLLWTRPGDEVIIWGSSHTVERESSGLALIGGVQTRQILSESGVFSLSQVKKRTRKAVEHVTYPDTKLIMIQNATFGGEVWPLESLKEIKQFAQSKNIKILLDGARIINAVAHYECPASEISKYCDTMTMCLSKGLCCPFGSLVFGTAEQIKQARQIRKSLGGGMRQIGIIGAAGLYALEHMVSEVGLDNKMAKYLAQKLVEIDGVYADITKVQANMVHYQVRVPGFDHKAYHTTLLNNRIKIKQVNLDKDEYRLVTHRTTRRPQCDKFIQVTKQFIENSRQSKK